MTEKGCVGRWRKGDGGSAAKDNMMRTKGCGLCAANGGGFKVASTLSEADGVETHSLNGDVVVNQRDNMHCSRATCMVCLWGKKSVSYLTSCTPNFVSYNSP